MLWQTLIWKISLIILLSSLVDSCIERGLTAKEGGAVYDIISGLQVGIANAANSLYALKTVVYDKKNINKGKKCTMLYRITMKEKKGKST